MTRVIMVSGKGGVGKTTAAAATGLAASAKGKRTMVMSFDLAHSLSDSFGLEDSVVSSHLNRIIPINDYLHIREINVQDEIDRDWSDLYRFFADLLIGGGLTDVAAEEVAVLPGSEDIVALIILNTYIQENAYDVIVIDCPPTGESLRFAGMASTLRWYVRKRMKTDRKLVKLVKPVTDLLGQSDNLKFPDEPHFQAIAKLYDRLEGVEELLQDPTRTSVRLVTAPEKMVMRETRRAYMYFGMYAMTVDMVIINRLMPQNEAYFQQWAIKQRQYAQQIEEDFAPLPVVRVPMFQGEIVGETRLLEYARVLYPEGDPTNGFANAPSHTFSKTGETYTLTLNLPFVSKEQLKIHRSGEDLIIRIGVFKRNILLPRAIIPLTTKSAKINENKLLVTFG